MQNYVGQPQTVQVPNYSGVNIQIINPTVSVPGGGAPVYNVNSPTYQSNPNDHYPAGYYINRWGSPQGMPINTPAYNNTVNQGAQSQQALPSPSGTIQVTPDVQNGVNGNAGQNGTNGTTGQIGQAGAAGKDGVNGQNGQNTGNSAAQTQIQQATQQQNEKNNKTDADNKDSKSSDEAKSDKKTEKRKIVQLTDDYIKTLENYLNSQDKEVRLMGAKEVVARLMEDESRKDDKALTALINKMMQDPSQQVKFLALSMLDSRNVTGDNTSVKLLKEMQKSKSGFGQDALLASNILLKMAGKTVEKEFEVKDDKKKTAKETKKA